MDLDWITQEPIDFEYKQYILLDYLKKVNKDIEDYRIYPTFQELSLHLANLGSIDNKGEKILLTRQPEEDDDEILVSDLKYEKLKFTNKEEKKELDRIVQYSKNKITESFSIMKSLWSIVNQTISIQVDRNKEAVTERRNGDGFFHFMYGGEFYVYQFNILRIKDGNLENKCWVKQIYKGPKQKVEKVILENHLFDNDPKFYKRKYAPLTTEEDRFDFIMDKIIFKVELEQEFPLEGTIVSLIKRKVMNYIFQTVKIKDLKD